MQNLLYGKEFGLHENSFDRDAIGSSETSDSFRISFASLHLNVTVENFTLFLGEKSLTLHIFSGSCTVEGSNGRRGLQSFRGRDSNPRAARIMHLSMSSPRGGGGGGVGHRVGILTFSNKDYQNPNPRAKNNGQKYGLLLFFSL